LYLIGQGECLPIAREAALKIKEITYIHAEAFSAGELKHGPIALLEEGRKTVVVILVFGDER
jgi:glucosamine--fructose-6-phosphate aminotransferase (isomerizing)